MDKVSKKFTQLECLSDIVHNARIYMSPILIISNIKTKSESLKYN